jgi:invasion protein IalB
LSFIRSFSLGCIGLALVTGAAVAQSKSPAPTRPAQPQSPAQSQNSPAPAPVSSEPETTTASYGAWTLRCQRHAGSEERFCEVEQNIVPQGQQNPIAQVAVGRASTKEELRVTAILPTNVTFPSTAKISNGDKDAGIELAWRRCFQGGCIADNALRDDSLRNWRGETSDDNGHLVFIEASGRSVNIQFSFRGFAQAIDALAKEK